MIIGIAGGIGCGKTTVAEMLVAHVRGAVRMGFGDVVKDEVSKIFGVSRYLCDSARGKITGVSTDGAVNVGIEPPKPVMSIRELMQWWGTDVRRKQDPLYWIKAMEQRLDEAEGMVIVDDVRFPNEAASILGRGGRLVRIMPYTGREPLPADAHPSEHALDGWSGYHHVFFPAFGELRPVAAMLASTYGDA
ncbi:deoxynucleotide monophosphate kinase family protein [Nitratidesulfovibrio vulgaris]|jgi:RecA/RadA recombinase|uniref:Dephospho-CoA kinase n=1 Tax=Nitratidesulfovibrio vulgaris (strain DP4) TaxID=391774 RepID=A0A0H3A7D3_NITV4|nr:dephospho-CoA kinase [Nitratidesulfovibrio vulgaris]ABM28071.1 hypothetical protein Dvul_1051 [Nitratidesulfovibrio vulgaris DP4]